MAKIHDFLELRWVEEEKVSALSFLIDFDKLRNTHLYKSSVNCVSTILLKNKILHLDFDLFLVGIITCFSDRFAQLLKQDIKTPI